MSWLRRKGATVPEEKENEKQRKARLKRERRAANKPTTRTAASEETDTDATYADLAGRNAQAREGAPPEGADHPDPYAHLGGSGVVTGEDAEPKEDANA